MRPTLRTMGLLAVLTVGSLLMIPAPSRAQCGGGGGGGYGRAWGGHTFNAGYGGGSYGGSGCGMAMGGLTMGGVGMGGYSYPTAARYGSRGGGPNNPPFYSSAVHSLHGRGFDSSRHGR